MSAAGFAVDADAGLRLIGVTVTDNHARASGGGIAANGSLYLQETTVSGNTAGTSTIPSVSGEGGGIYVGPSAVPVSLLNSTISGNEAVRDVEGFSEGGGIYAANDFTSDFVTVANNSAAVGGGVYTTPGGGSASVHYTLVAGNVGGSCAGVVDEYVESFNLEDGSGCEFDESGDIQVGNAFLAPLAYNGGQTQTHGLLPESRAINGAPQLACIAFIDQRRFPRPNGPCEIGAFEVVEFSPAELGDGSGGPANCTDSFAQCTLREAVDQASAYDTVFVNAGVWALDGSLILNGDNLVGASPRSTSIENAVDGERVVTAIGGNNRISRVTITDGEATGDVGGGVLVQGANTSLVLSDAAVTNNFAEQGGGLANINARLDVVRSTINDNEVSDETFESEGGGHLLGRGERRDDGTDSTISANRALSGETSALGGAIAVFDGSLTARNVTFAGNTAGHAGEPTGGLGGTL